MQAKNSTQQSNDSIKRMFKVLSLVANARPQPWSPLMTALLTTLCFRSAQTEMRRCTEYHIYSVLQASGNDFYQVYGLKYLFRQNLLTVIVNK